MERGKSSTAAAGTSLILVFIAALLSVVAVSEVASRDSFAAFLRQQGGGLSAELVESARGQHSVAPEPTSKPSTGDKKAPSADAVSRNKSSIDEKREQLVAEIDAIKTFERQVKTLGSLGAERESQTLGGIRRNFESYRLNRDNRLAIDRLNADIVVERDELATVKQRLESSAVELKMIEEQSAREQGATAANRSRHAVLQKSRAALDLELVSIQAQIHTLERGTPNEVSRKQLDSLMERSSITRTKFSGIEQELKALEPSLRGGPSEFTGSERARKLASSRSTDLQAQARLGNSIADKEKQLKSLSSRNDDDDASSMVPLSMQRWFAAIWVFPRLNSDYLLALAIMACSALGALIVGLRTANPTSLRDLTLGIASGFVCYFAIKGGKYVFLMTSQSDLIAFNPYGSGFAGLLVGLFSERVYGLLSVLIGDLERRVKLAITSVEDKQPPPADDDRKPSKAESPLRVASDAT